MIFTFTYADQKYTYDDEKMGLGEARWVKRETGLVGAEFFNAARTLDPDAIVAILVMAMRRAGEHETQMGDIYSDDDNGYYKLIAGLEVSANEPEAEPKATRTRAKKTEE